MGDCLPNLNTRNTAVEIPGLRQMFVATEAHFYIMDEFGVPALEVPHNDEELLGVTWRLTCMSEATARVSGFELGGGASRRVRKCGARRVGPGGLLGCIVSGQAGAWSERGARSRRGVCRSPIG